MNIDNDIEGLKKTAGNRRYWSGQKEAVPTLQGIKGGLGRRPT